MTFDGKAVLVTGGSRGIGPAPPRQLFSRPAPGSRSMDARKTASPAQSTLSAAATASPRRRATSARQPVARRL
jgi:hypothetical protein